MKRFLIIFSIAIILVFSWYFNVLVNDGGVLLCGEEDAIWLHSITPEKEDTVPLHTLTCGEEDAIWLHSITPEKEDTVPLHTLICGEEDAIWLHSIKG